MNQIMTKEDHDIAIENALVTGDLSKLTPEQRTKHYLKVCESLDLNPLTRPFEYINFQGKLTLYARRDCADQLRKNRNINVTIVSQTISDELLTVCVRATDKYGREDEDFGVVSFPSTLRGEARANAMMKAVTKAKRRVTLSISGLGFLDETEVETVPGARMTNVRPPQFSPNVMNALPPPSDTSNGHDPETGEVYEEDTAVSVPDLKDSFIASTRDLIRNSTSVKELGDWWNSAEQKKARRDFELNKDEVKSLTDFVTARRDMLMKETAA